jgi:hypothetical protein
VEVEPLLPRIDYSLDESDRDILLLRRQDGSFVAAFSAQGATDCLSIERLNNN